MGGDDRNEQKAQKKRRPTLTAKVQSAGFMAGALKKVQAKNKDEEKPAEKDEEESVGAFSTKNMGGLAAILKSKETQRPREDSFASEESDWDSD